MAVSPALRRLGMMTPWAPAHSAVRMAHGVQLPPVRLHHHDARRPGLGGHVAQGAVRLPLLQVDLINGGSRPQSFDNGVASFDDAVGFGGEAVSSLFVHSVSLAENSVAFET